jgi:hypothetical protein
MAINFDQIFHYERQMLRAAEKMGWKHTPTHDRCIDGLMSMTFEGFVNGMPAVLDVIIDTNLTDISAAYRKGVARFKIPNDAREAKMEHACFSMALNLENLFDPSYYLRYGIQIKA